MNERIKILLNVKNLTASKLAEIVGVQPSNISHILTGRNKPSIKFINKLVNSFPDLSLDWLILGKGNMFKSQNISENVFGKEDSIEKQKIIRKKPVEKKSHYREYNLFSGIEDELFTSDNEKTIEENIISDNLKENELILENNTEEKNHETIISNNDNDVIKDDTNVKHHISNDTSGSYEQQPKEVLNENKPAKNLLNDITRKKQAVNIILCYDDDTFKILSND